MTYIQGANQVSNSDGTLTISPTIGSVIASLNTSHANTWGATQTFATLPLTGKITTYNNIATAGYGVPSIVGSIALTGQVADIADTAFSNSSTVGVYRISYYILDTTADITAGAVTLNIKANDGTAARTISSTPIALTATTAFTQGVIFIRLGSGSITYGTTHTGLFGTAAYALYIICERLN